MDPLAIVNSLFPEGTTPAGALLYAGVCGGIFATVATLAWLAFFLGAMDATFNVFFKSDPPSGSYTDEVVFITGASSGIGKELAFKYAKRGAVVVGCARGMPELQAVMDQCKQLSSTGKARAIQLDVTDNEAQKAAIDAALEEFGKIDIVVLNAGQTERCLVEQQPPEAHERMVRLNLLAPLAMAHYVLPSMLERGKGHFVITSSASGKLPAPVSATYVATKHGVLGYFLALRAELLHRGVDVTVACPGPVKTPLIGKAATASHQNAAELAANDNSTRMTAERCAQLMLRAQYHRVFEAWMSPQPILLFMFLQAYMRSLAIGTMLPRGAVSRREALKAGQPGYSSVTDPSKLANMVTGSKAD